MGHAGACGRRLSGCAGGARIVVGQDEPARAARGLWWRRMNRRARPLVVSVGNLTLGGNSKTPFTLFLASRLRMRGLRVAIVSRGWGRAPSAERATLVCD